MVYASYLLDNDRTEEAPCAHHARAPLQQALPGGSARLVRGSAVCGARRRPAEANRIRDAIEIFDPAFPGLDLLAAEISPTA